MTDQAPWFDIDTACTATPVSTFAIPTRPMIIKADPNGNYLWITAMDNRINLYTLGALSGAPLYTESAATLSTLALAVNPVNRHVYHAGSVSQLIAYEGAAGSLAPLLPNPVSFPLYAVDLEFDAQGKYLFTGELATGLITMFRIDSNTFAPTSVSTASTLGSRSYDLALNGAGDALIVSNKDSRSITLFQVNRSTEAPSLTYVKNADVGIDPMGIAIVPY